MRRLTTGTALALLLALSGVQAQAQADDSGATVDSGKSRIAVGIRTGNAQGGDDRGKFEYVIRPGGVVQDWVAVSNLRYEPVTVRLMTKDATSTASSSFAIQPSAEQPKDIGSWMALKETTLTIPPRSEISVPFQLGVPANATPGDHAGAVVVSLLAREKKPKGGTIIVDHRIAMRVIARIPGDLRVKLDVTNLKVGWNGEGDVLGHGAAIVTYTVHNTGNVRTSATGDLELTRVLALPSVGQKVPQLEDILPGGAMQVTQTVKDAFGTGPMKANVTLHPMPVDKSLAGKAEDAQASTSFSAYPWLLIAIVHCLLLLILGGGWYERRLRRARNAACPDVDAAAAESSGVLVRGAMLAMAFVVAALALGRVGPASAAEPPQWRANASVREGFDTTPFDVITTGGCPLPGTNVVAFAWGNGFPKEGGVVMSNNDAGVERAAPFRAPLLASMQGLMAMQPDPAPLSGVYRIELRCVTPGVDVTSGKYVLAIKFDTPHHFTVLPPLTRAQGPNATTSGKPRGTQEPNGAPPPASGSDAQGSTPGNLVPGQPSSGATPGSAGAASRAAELNSANQTDTAGTSGSSKTPLLVIGALAVGLLGGLVVPRLRSKS